MIVSGDPLVVIRAIGNGERCAFETLHATPVAISAFRGAAAAFTVGDRDEMGIKCCIVASALECAMQYDTPDAVRVDLGGDLCDIAMQYGPCPRRN